MSKTTCVIGVDLGGTNVRAQAFFESGEPAGPRIEKLSLAQHGTDQIMRQVSLAVNEAAESASNPVEKVGLAIPGHIDNDLGLVRWSPNLGHEVEGVFIYWKDVPIRALLQDKVPFPIVMANDANAAALGEYTYGVGQAKAKCLVMFTLGTGVGSGVVLGPSSVHSGLDKPTLLLGGNKGGVELGHTVILRGGQSSSAGSHGAVEAYCQKQAIADRAIHKLQRGRDSVLNEMTGGDLSRVDPLMLSEAAAKGDALTLEVWQEVGSFLGTAVGNAINVFAPDVVAIGGQIAKSAKWFMPSLLTEARNTAVPSLFKDARVEEATHSEDAGLLGAAALAYL